MSNDAALKVIWNYDLAVIGERVREEYPSLRLRYAAYELELRKFFGLLVGQSIPIAMISPRIDAIWHTFLLFTPMYRDFCEQAFGFYVDHLPRTGATPIPEDAIWNFFDAYTNQYGDVCEEWFHDLPLSTIAALRNREMPKNLRWSGWIPNRASTRPSCGPWFRPV